MASKKKPPKHHVAPKRRQPSKRPTAAAIAEAAKLFHPEDAKQLEAISVEFAAGVLSAAGDGREVSPARLRQVIAAGAPTNPDGTLNLVHFAAWLASEVP